jgi:hypothetical protein
MVTWFVTLSASTIMGYRSFLKLRTRRRMAQSADAHVIDRLPEIAPLAAIADSLALLLKRFPASQEVITNPKHRPIEFETEPKLMAVFGEMRNPARPNNSAMRFPIDRGETFD